MSRAQESAEPLEQIGTWPAPRLAEELLGHEAAEQRFLQSYTSGKLAHAWLITGPPGVGKATLAYRIARFLLSENEQAEALFDEPLTSLSVNPENHAGRQIAVQSHPNLLVLSRPWNPKTKKFQSVLPVDEVRRMGDFFGLSAGEDTWRICIIDTADDMNVSAANALLKTLEEPPEKSILLLLANAPGRLLPTIRSRCRHMPLAPLSEGAVCDILRKYMPDISEQDVTFIARLAQGSPGRALRLAHFDGVSLYKDLFQVFKGLPKLDPLFILAFGAQLAKPNAQEAYDITFELLSDWMHRMVLSNVSDGETVSHEVIEGEGALMKQLGALASPVRWIEARANIEHIHQRSQALFLDRKQTVVQACQTLQSVCGG